MLKQIDINCDMGESFGNWRMGDDAGMASHITTANVACGFHAGDPMVMSNTIKLARDRSIAVGAHPGLPDLMGFGRRNMSITADEAYAYVVYQVGALQAALRVQDMRLHHIKPHGAFYYVLKTDEELADAVARAILRLSDEPMVYYPSPTDLTAFPRACKRHGIRVVGEIYPDLSYAADGSLIVERKLHETDIDFAVGQVERLVTTGKVQAVDGSLIEMDSESLCIHGDGPKCVAVASAIRARLGALGCTVAAASH